MRPNNRALIALARDLGGQDVSITTTRGGHNCLSLTDHQGINQKITLSKTPSDYRAMANAKAHIRRVLRPAKEQEENLMEETPAVEARNADRNNDYYKAPRLEKPIYIGKISHYTSNLTFVLPKELVELLPESARVTPTYLGDNSWSMKYGPDERLKIVKNKWGEFSVARAADSAVNLFPRTPAEYMLMEENTIMVALTVPIESTKPKIVETKLPAVQPTTTAEAMRAALETIRAIEAATPYRLARDAAGTLFFEAPVIR